MQTVRHCLIPRQRLTIQGRTVTLFRRFAVPLQEANLGPYARDEQGRFATLPSVWYRGGHETDIQTAAKRSSRGGAIWFTESKKVAEKFAKGDNAHIMQARLKLPERDLFDARDPKQLQRLAEHKNIKHRFDFSPDGSVISDPTKTIKLGGLLRSLNPSALEDRSVITAIQDLGYKAVLENEEGLLSLMVLPNPEDSYDTRHFNKILELVPEDFQESVYRELDTPDSSNVYSFRYSPTSQLDGDLSVTFLGAVKTDTEITRVGPGPTYTYSNVPLAIYKRFRTVARSTSAGKAVWDYLRIRGSKTGHRFTYEKTGPDEIAIPVPAGGIKVPDATDLEEANPYHDAAGKFTTKEGAVTVSGSSDVTKSKPFKNWFGDWEKSPEDASKVVDKDGKPLLVYHSPSFNKYHPGSSAEKPLPGKYPFHKFKTHVVWPSTDAPSERSPRVAENRPVWFTDNPKYGRAIAPAEDLNRMQGYLNIRKPLDLRGLYHATEEQVQEYLENLGLDLSRTSVYEGDRIFDTAKGLPYAQLLTLGYDGIIVDEGHATSYLIFDANQFKVAESGFNSQSDNFTEANFGPYKRNELGQFDSDGTMAPDRDMAYGSNSREPQQTLSGEYWLDGTSSLFADGDIGDMNHEGYAVEAARSRVVNNLGVDVPENIYTGGPDWDKVIEGFAKEHPEFEWHLTNPFGVRSPYNDTQAEKFKPFYKFLKDNNIDPEDWNIAIDTGDMDPRIWAAKKLGWVRMAGNSLQMVGIDGSKMSQIADAIADAHPDLDDDEFESQTFDLEVITRDSVKPGQTIRTRMYYGVPLEVLRSADIQRLKEYGIDFQEETDDVTEANPGPYTRDEHGRFASSGSTDLTLFPNIRKVVDEVVSRDLDPRDPDDENTNTGGGWVENGRLHAYHVTDNPTDAISALEGKRGQKLIDQARGNQRELGPGLYVTGYPEFWTGRATQKYSFLQTIPSDQLTTLLDDLQQKVNAHRADHYIADFEHGYATRDIEAVRSGKVDPTLLVSLAGQPYNIRFWQPEYLAALGIAPGQQPQILPVELVGRFARLKRHITEEEADALVVAGYDGAYTDTGWSTNPELVIWNRNAVKRFGDWQSDEPLNESCDPFLPRHSDALLAASQSCNLTEANSGPYTRDAHGRFASGGAVGSKLTVRKKVEILRYGKHTLATKEQQEELQSLVDELPDSLQEFLKDVPITVVSNVLGNPLAKRGSTELSDDLRVIISNNALGCFSGNIKNPDRPPSLMVMADQVRYGRHGENLGAQKVPISKIRGNLHHEIGHAIYRYFDVLTNAGFDDEDQLRRANNVYSAIAHGKRKIGNHPTKQVVASAIEYYLYDDEECFAELVAYRMSGNNRVSLGRQWQWKTLARAFPEILREVDTQLKRFGVGKDIQESEDSDDPENFDYVIYTRDASGGIGGLSAHSEQYINLTTEEVLDEQFISVLTEANLGPYTRDAQGRFASTGIPTDPPPYATEPGTLGKSQLNNLLTTAEKAHAEAERIRKEIGSLEAQKADTLAKLKSGKFTSGNEFTVEHRGLLKSMLASIEHRINEIGDIGRVSKILTESQKEIAQREKIRKELSEKTQERHKYDVMMDKVAPEMTILLKSFLKTEIKRQLEITVLEKQGAKLDREFTKLLAKRSALESNESLDSEIEVALLTGKLRAITDKLYALRERRIELAPPKPPQAPEPVIVMEQGSTNLTITQEAAVDEATRWLTGILDSRHHNPSIAPIFADEPDGPNWFTFGAHKIPEGEKQRAYANEDQIYLGEHATTRTVIHELGHVIEHHFGSKRIHELCIGFLAHRCGDEVPAKMNEAFQGNYDDDEYGREDLFRPLFLRPGIDDPNSPSAISQALYVGKHYSDSTEVLSMGLQLLWQDPVHFAKTDPEYWAFVMAILHGKLG